MSIPLDGSWSARSSLVEERVQIARVARARARHEEIRAPTTESRSRAVFGATRAFCEAEKPVIEVIHTRYSPNTCFLE